MKISFYRQKSKDISINIDAILEDGKLLLSGLDYGKGIGELRGMGDDYEYKLSLDEENTAKLFESLNIANRTNRQKLTALKDRFGKDGGISGIEDYCDKHGIKTDFFCWP